MPRISDKRRLENELVPTMEEVALAMILASDSEPASEEDSVSEFGRAQTQTAMIFLAHWRIRHNIRLTIPLS